MGLVVDSYRFAAAAGVTDSFNRADSTTTMGNADTGQTWVPNSGTWGISSNKARLVTGTSQATTVLDSGLSDCTIEVTLSTFEYSGLCFRSTDDNNHFLTNAGSLSRREGGTFTKINDFSQGFASGDTIKVVLSSSSITVYRNGSSVLSATSSFNQSETFHGLRTNAGTNARFDDFSITA